MVLFLSVAVGCSVLSVSNHYLRREMNATNQAFANTFANNMDSALTSNNQTVYQIASDTKIMSFVSNDFADNKDLILCASEASATLSSVVAGNYWVDNILIYSENNVRIADVKHSASPDDYYTAHLSNTMSYETFNAILSGNSSYVNFYLDDIQYIANIQKRKHAYCNYTIILLMNPQKVFENFNHSDFSQYGILAMLYKDNQAFLYYKDNIINQPIDIDYAQYENSNPKTEVITFLGNKYLATNVSSRVDHFVYFFMDKYDRTGFIIKLQLVLIVILILLSVLIPGMYIYRYVSATFRKVHEILYNIQPQFIPNLDIMYTLEQQVTDLLERKNIAEEKLSLQNKSIIANKLEKSLHFSDEDPASLLEEFRNLGIDWSDNYFAVLGFYVSNYGEFADVNNSDLFSNAYSMCQLVLQNIFEELLSQKYTVVFTHSDNILVAAINVSSENNSLITAIVSLLKEGISVISDNFKFKYVASLSDIGEGIESLPLLYSHMMTNFENITSEDESGIIYKYTADTSQSSAAVFSKEFNIIETQLYNAIKAQNFNKAIMCIEQCLTLFKKNPPSSITRTNLFNLSSSVASALSAVIDDKVFDTILNEVVITESLVIPYEYLNKLKNLFLDIQNDCLVADDALLQDSVDCKMSEKINKYIMANLDCKDLSIPMICEYMDMSSRTISQEYKTQTGITINKYIQTARVNLAKKLLLETDLTINEITEKVGYDYTISFTRLFKKFENVPPAEYRQMNKRN